MKMAVTVTMPISKISNRIEQDSEVSTIQEAMAAIVSDAIADSRVNVYIDGGTIAFTRNAADVSAKAMIASPFVPADETTDVLKKIIYAVEKTARE